MEIKRSVLDFGVKRAALYLRSIIIDQFGVNSQWCTGGVSVCVWVFLIVFFCHSDHPVHGLGMFVPVFRIQANFPINKCYWPFQFFEISL